ncbi:hypothetical protein BO71DRAFT_51560 [Aspergillus ellipticus CBS 707.79]|uniref:Zn(II)2Cys6 transcription factor n=1 Tax=Aspergillus ellipticus CBS 707.79 TaxID=1448320 RepID=A0A319DJG7_9EURO|nr:hypothetical protein BO71DRAFT_51560 [Aspergillus ellipticus CBS 707.79]
MNKTFHFVHGTPNDRKAKKSLRSHVMKGKNAGKTFRRASRLDLARQRPYHHPAGTLATTRHPSTIERNIGNVFLTISCPLELSPDSLRIINQFYIYVIQKMYPAQLGFSVYEGKALWLNYMFADEAAAHCSIALMETCNAFFFSEGNTSTKALYHLSQTFVLVNKRLQSNEALSDSTLGVILMLIFQEQLRKAKIDSKVHYEGLRRMIDLRGGLNKLEGNWPLVMKICKTDITYALQCGEPLLFFRDHMSDVYDTLAAKGFILDRGPTASSIRPNGLNPYLREILIDVTCVANLINSFPIHRMEGHINIRTFLEILVSVLSRLIHFCPLKAPKPERRVDAAYHIGLTVFMMTLFLQFDHRRILDYESVSLRLKDVVEDELEDYDAELATWLMFIGGIWTSGDVDREWLIFRIARVVNQLGMKRWEEVRDLVKKFPWINALHDELGLGQWGLVEATRE